MANIIEKVVKMFHLNWPRMFYVKLLTEDANKKDKLLDDGQNAVTNNASAHGENVIGDTLAVGTQICSYSLAAYKKLAIHVVNLNANAHVIVRIGTGTLGSTTDYLELRVAAAGDIMRESSTPLCIIDNSAGATAVTVRMFFPQSRDGAATNNAATTYVGGFFSGVLY